jgi:hypothetical protein
MIFLLPCEPFNIKNPDPDFKKEYEALYRMDFKVFLYDYDQFVNHNEIIANIDYSLSGDVILRSWMLNEEQYNRLYKSLNRNGFKLINTTEQYLNCHYYPNVYSKIKDYAPNSIWFRDITETNVRICRSLINNDIIIKDYVKSEKGLEDIFVLSKSLTNVEFFEQVQKFKNYRGKLFNEGIVFKEFVNLKKYGVKTNEFRIFVLNGKIISCSQNSDLGFGDCPDTSFLKDIISNIDSNYFTIDIAEKEDGSWIILECGDGQVSGLSNDQSEYIYYASFLNRQVDSIKS